jgi:hypothetical protein
MRRTSPPAEHNSAAERLGLDERGRAVIYYSPPGHDVLT